MKSLTETIEILSVKQHMNPEGHPMETDEIKDALWYLRNYRDLLLTMSTVCQHTDYIKDHYLKDLEK